MFDGKLYGMAEVRCDPLLIVPAPTMQMYNAIWSALTPIDSNIAWPTLSFHLDDLNCKAGLPFPTDDYDSIPKNYWIFLKTKAFFLSGYGVAYDVGFLPSGEATLATKFSTLDTERMYALLKQMAVERQRWNAEALSCRTGVNGYVCTELGDDWISDLVRHAVEDLIDDCIEALAKADRAEKLSAE